MDKMKISILDDGTIKMDTDRVSMPNHSNAEGFVAAIRRLAGGKFFSRLKHAFAHAHGHEHTHEHMGHGH